MENTKLRYLSNSRSYFVRLDAGEETLGVDYSDNNDNSTTMYDYYGHSRSFSFVNSAVNADVVDEALASEPFQALARRIYDGYWNHWDGNNRVGRYDEDAQEAIRDLEALVTANTEQGGAWLLSGENAGCWEAREWLEPVGPKEYDLTADSTDAEIEAAVEKIESEAASDDVVLEGTEEVVKEWIEELRANQLSEPHAFVLSDGKTYHLLYDADAVTREQVADDDTEPTYPQIAQMLLDGSDVENDYSSYTITEVPA